MAEPAVLVAGAGPVGLTVAHELTRRGVPVRIVDRAAGPATTSRALATHARTLEIFDQMGLVERLHQLGRKVEHFSIHMRGRRLIRFDTDYSRLPTRYPYSLMVDQVHTERVLRAGLAGLGVQVEWGVELRDFADSGAAVTATLQRPGGRVETLSTPWLVGTDGARSTVRRRLGLQLLGDATQTWLNADVTLDEDALPPDSNHLLHTGRGTLLLVPFPEPGKWRVVDTEDTEDADDPEAIRRRLQDKIRLVLRRPVNVGPPTWVSVFTVQQRMITAMRSGRCFVAGDAAHVHSPASGQGMNTGIQDGYNLAWKLAGVVLGQAGEDILDSYAAERIPIGAHLLASTRRATGLVALRNLAAPVALPAGLGVLRRLPPLKRKIERKMMRSFSALGLNYPDSPLSVAAPDRQHPLAPGDRVGCSAAAAVSPGWRALLAQLRDPRWTLLGVPTGAPTRELLAALTRRYSGGVSVRTVAEDDLADPGGRLLADLGLGEGQYVLIRPDGYLSATGPLEHVERVLERLHLTRSPSRSET